MINMVIDPSGASATLSTLHPLGSSHVGAGIAIPRGTAALLWRRVRNYE